MKKSNVMEKIEQARGLIKGCYGLKTGDIMRIRECSFDDYKKITNSFIYGYSQGYKAAMAETKKAKDAKTA